jgi:hypothetical protein
MGLDNMGNIDVTNTPQVLSSGNLYLSFLFVDAVSKQYGHGFTVWYLWPDPAHGDAALSIPIQPPSGGASIGITY